MRYYLIVMSKRRTTIYEFGSWKDRNQVFEIVHRTAGTDVFLGIDVDEHGVATIAKKTEDTDFHSGPGLEIARAWWKAAQSTSMDNPHIGSSFDEFLEDEGILAEVEAAAVKRVASQSESSRENNTVSFDDGDYKVCSCGRLNRLENDRCIRCDKPLD